MRPHPRRPCLSQSDLNFLLFAVQLCLHDSDAVRLRAILNLCFAGERLYPGCYTAHLPNAVCSREVTGHFSTHFRLPVSIKIKDLDQICRSRTPPNAADWKQMLPHTVATPIVQTGEDLGAASTRSWITAHPEFTFVHEAPACVRSSQNHISNAKPAA